MKRKLHNLVKMMNNIMVAEARVRTKEKQFLEVVFFQCVSFVAKSWQVTMCEQTNLALSFMSRVSCTF